MSARYKTLAIISDCIHFYAPGSLPATENHIFKRQMEALAVHFDETLICCPFEDYSSEKVFSLYEKKQIHFYPLPKVGGPGWKDKLKIFRAIPAWWKAFKKARKFGDIIYQRFPNNMNIPGFFYFYYSRSKVFASYTGTWQNYQGEPATYRFQKWLLKKYFRGPVWIYANNDVKEKRMTEGFSPSYTAAEWEEETIAVQQKIGRLKSKSLKAPVFLTVGALVPYKNQQYILEVCKILKEQGLPFTLYIIGDGPLYHAYHLYILKSKLEDVVFLMGKKSYEDLRKYYRRADFLLQAPLAEGFGKTPLEGFFHGVIPFLSDTAFSKQMTGDDERGFVFIPSHPEMLASLIKEKLNDQENLAAIIERGRTYAKLYTLENWAGQITEKIDSYFEN